MILAAAKPMISAQFKPVKAQNFSKLLTSCVGVYSNVKCFGSLLKSRV